MSRTSSLPVSAIQLLMAPYLLHAAVVLPEGPGKTETVKLCSKCHAMEQTVSLRRGQAGWTETISKMVNIGAEGTEEEFNSVLKYLVKNYGPAAGSGSASETTTSAAAVAPEAVNPAAPSEPATAARIASIPTTGGFPADPAKEWRTYGHDPGAMRFSPLKQITPENVNKLKVAWIYHMRPQGFKPSQPPPQAPRAAPGAPVGDEPEPAAGRASNRGASASAIGPQFGSGFRPSEVTPLVIRGVMYVTTPYSRVAAIDPVTGKELWSYQLPSSNPAPRGLEYWAGDAKTPAQVVFGTMDGKLYSVDAKTGKPNAAFGDNGVINLNTEAIMRGLPGRNALTSPPIVYKHLVMGSSRVDLQACKLEYSIVSPK